MNKEQIILTFKEKASLVSAFVHDVGNMKGALNKTVQLCLEKSPCRNLMLADSAADSRRTLAAPNLGLEDFNYLKTLCQDKDIDLIKEDIRKHPSGFEMGVTTVDFGLAETGTLVLNSDSEEVRLSTMLCEIHVAILDKSNIKGSALDMVKDLNEMIKQTSSYTAFITGASRTADIERVLALGVHGPLELFILLIGD